jgi:hypothetical protein
MANPTTNFGWVMPTSTSLVTNLPADFNTFGQAVDTSMAYLKGGTTGQILSKTSATDMAFTWITNDVGDISAVTAGTGISGGGTSGAVTITNDMATTITTNGDLLYGTGSGTYTRRGIGSTGNVLTVSGGVPTWAAPASGAYTSLATGSLTGSTLTISSISGSYKNLFLVIDSMYGSSNDELIYMRLNADTGAKYNFNGIAVATSVANDASFGQTSFIVAPYGATSTADYKTSATVWIYDYTNATRQNVAITGAGRINSGAGKLKNYLGYYNASAATTSLTLLTSAGTFSAGTYTLFGVN